MSATEHAELVRDLRALPTAAPESLRERVRALGEPMPRRELPRVPWRRAVFVLAPACLVAVLGAAVVHGVLNSGAPKQQALTSSGGFHSTEKAPQAGAAGDLLVPPTTGRHQDYEASMTLRVKDLDALTEQTNEAMRVVRTYGGYVASVQQSTSAGQPGEADRVPGLQVLESAHRRCHL